MRLKHVLMYSQALTAAEVTNILIFLASEANTDAIFEELTITGDSAWLDNV